MFGGHGYIAEWGMEQFVRDARIAMIYEGANGIQALDLVGRKLPKDGGRAVMAFFGEVDGFLKENAGDEALKPYLGPLTRRSAICSRRRCGSCRTPWRKPDNAGAGSTDYMHLFGLSRSAICGRRMAKAAQARRPRANGATERRKKLVTGALLHGAHACRRRRRLARITAGRRALMALPAEDVLDCHAHHASREARPQEAPK